MSEKVEQVTLAIRPMLSTLIDDAGWSRGEGDEIAKTLARTAIEAMREPTEAMLTATEGTSLHDIAWCEGLYGPGHEGGHEHKQAIEFWQAMIDAALKKPDQTK